MGDHFFTLTLLGITAGGIPLATLLNNWLLNSWQKMPFPKPNQNNTNSVRWASNKKPLTGGIAFFAFFLLSTAIFYIFFAPTAPTTLPFVPFLATCTLAFTVGFLDDLYNLSPKFKFAGQFVCALLLLSTGMYLPISTHYYLNAAITIVWVVGIMNAVNMLDNMDAITAITALSTVIGLAVIHYFNVQIIDFYVFILVTASISLLGFLRYNWHPAQIYMGDSGSQFLGAFLAFLAIAVIHPPNATTVTTSAFHTLTPLLLCILLFLMPIIDTTTVTIRRIARHQSPFKGGRDHTTHHFAYCGLTDSQVALLFGILSLLGSIFSIIIHCYKATYALQILIATIILFIFFTIQYFYNIGKKKINP